MALCCKLRYKEATPYRSRRPTCRRDYGLVNGIPVGYETDDSWDNDSHTHEHTHTHNIVLLLTLRPWNNRLHRGHGQPHRQNNNINVRTGNAPYPQPWDHQSYGSAHAANRPFMPEPTAKYNAGIQYSRLKHRCCASLDLEAAFKEISISQNIEKEVCAQCRSETCRCQTFTPGMPCSSASSTPTNISDKQFPDLVADNHCKNCTSRPITFG